MKLKMYLLLLPVFFCGNLFAQDTIIKYYEAYWAITPFKTQDGEIASTNTEGIKKILTEWITIDTIDRCNVRDLLSDSVLLMKFTNYTTCDSILYDTSGKLIYADQQIFKYDNNELIKKNIDSVKDNSIHYIFSNHELSQIICSTGSETLKYFKNNYPRRHIYSIGNKTVKEVYKVKTDKCFLTICKKTEDAIFQYIYLYDGQLISELEFDKKGKLLKKKSNSYYLSPDNRFILASSNEFWVENKIPILSEASVYQYSLKTDNGSVLSDKYTFGYPINICKAHTKLFYNSNGKLAYSIYRYICNDRLVQVCIKKMQYEYW